MGYKTEKKIPSIILSVFIVLLILVGTIVPAYAAPTQDMMVTDSGEMLSDREEQEVSEMLYSINRQTGIEYLVYTIKSLNGEDIETCANRFEARRRLRRGCLVRRSFWFRPKSERREP